MFMMKQDIQAEVVATAETLKGNKLRNKLMAFGGKGEEEREKNERQRQRQKMQGVPEEVNRKGITF